MCGNLYRPQCVKDSSTFIWEVCSLHTTLVMRGMVRFESANYFINDSWNNSYYLVCNNPTIYLHCDCEVCYSWMNFTASHPGCSEFMQLIIHKQLMLYACSCRTIAWHRTFRCELAVERCIQQAVEDPIVQHLADGWKYISQSDTTIHLR